MLGLDAVEFVTEGIDGAFELAVLILGKGDGALDTVVLGGACFFQFVAEGIDRIALSLRRYSKIFGE